MCVCQLSSVSPGGGGIGFLLQQNIRLLDYRAASTQMIAIAIVVATMDYTSSAHTKAICITPKHLYYP